MNTIASVNGRRLSDEEARERIATLEAGYNEMSGGLNTESAARQNADNALDNRVTELETWAGWSQYKTVKIGTVTLSNSQEFPFNNSQQSIALDTSMPNTEYTVLTEVISAAGNVGEVEIANKLVNGFKISYTGSATSATIKYHVIGGFEE